MKLDYVARDSYVEINAVTSLNITLQPYVIF